MTGATGAVYGLRLLEMLRAAGGWETHLVMSPAAIVNIREELPEGKDALETLADVVHNVRNIGASIASGSSKVAASAPGSRADASCSRARSTVLFTRRDR